MRNRPNINEPVIALSQYPVLCESCKCITVSTTELCLACGVSGTLTALQPLLERASLSDTPYLTVKPGEGVYLSATPEPRPPFLEPINKEHTDDHHA